MKQFWYDKMVLARDFVRNPMEAMQAKNQVRHILKGKGRRVELGNKEITIDYREWRRILTSFANVVPSNAIITANSLKDDELVQTKLSGVTDRSEPILICVVKNDLVRIQSMYEHHKSIGVKHFVFVDNMSTDGTYEWLLEQDVDLYRTTARYCSAARAAWQVQLFEYYGYDRWYLIVDSDEKFMYPGCEKHDIHELVKWMEQKQLKRAFTFMLDMYAKGELKELDTNPDITIADYCYFDSDSYTLSKNLHYRKVIGGPREREFGETESMTMLQNKYPLVYMRRGELYRYHYVYPFADNFDCDCIGVLLHYKFLPGDINKYKDIVKQGNYANGSQLYKNSLAQLEQNEHAGFWTEKSCKLTSSEDLKKISILKEIQWENL